jgi:hypothetical protein
MSCDRDWSMKILKRLFADTTFNLCLGIVLGIMGFFSVMVWGETYRPTEKTPLDWKMENIFLKNERDTYASDLGACLRGELTTDNYYQ